MRSISNLFALLIVPLLFVLISAQEGAYQNSNMNITPGETTKRVATGTWGGRRIQLEVASDGATFELDCAHGTITGPLVLDHTKHFDLKGTYTRESHGPTRSGAEPSATPARYQGSVNGDVMTLTITLDGATQTNNTYTLTRGRQGKLMKCG